MTDESFMTEIDIIYKERDEALAAKNNEIAKKDSEITKKDREIAEKDKEHEKALVEIASLKKQLADLQSQ